MRAGVHKQRLPDSLKTADKIICKRPMGQDWGLEEALKPCSQPIALYAETDQLIEALAKEVTSGDHVVIMSNTGFDSIHQKLLKAIAGQPTKVITHEKIT